MPAPKVWIPTELNNQTITASSVGAILRSSDGLIDPTDGTVVMFINSPGVVSGTNPTFQLWICSSMDGTNYTTIAASTQQTNTGFNQRVVATNVLEPYVGVAWVVTGSNPSYPNVKVWFSFKQVVFGPSLG
jgi:hypothetical protein